MTREEPLSIPVEMLEVSSRNQYCESPFSSEWEMFLLTHSSPMHPFSNPWKQQKILRLKGNYS